MVLLNPLPGKPTALAEIVASVDVRVNHWVLGVATGDDQSRDTCRGPTCSWRTWSRRLWIGPDVLVEDAIKAAMDADAAAFGPVPTAKSARQSVGSIAHTAVSVTAPGDLKAAVVLIAEAAGQTFQFEQVNQKSRVQSRTCATRITRRRPRSPD